MSLMYLTIRSFYSFSISELKPPKPQLLEPRRSNRSNPPKGGAGVKKPVTSCTLSVVNPSPNNCIVCHHDKHPLYLCAAFKALSHADKLSVLKSNNFFLNCLKSGHFVRDCSSIHRCRICQKPHHSLLHSESKPNSSSSTSSNPVQVHTASGLVKELLFMTCRLRVESPEGFQLKHVEYLILHHQHLLCPNA